MRKYEVIMAILNCLIYRNLDRNKQIIQAGLAFLFQVGIRISNSFNLHTAVKIGKIYMSYKCHEKYFLPNFKQIVQITQGFP